MRLSIMLALVLATGCSKKSNDEPKPEVTKPVEPTPPPKMEGPSIAQPQTGFHGFSKDGLRFAWITPSASGTLDFLKIIGVGEAEPKQDVVYPDEPSQAETKQKLVDFTPDRNKPPADLLLEGDITTTPPALAVVRGDKRVVVPVGEYPYPPTDGMEIWGVSADGKHVAIHIGGKDVPGVVTTGKGKDFHFFFVVETP